MYLKEAEPSELWCRQGFVPFQTSFSEFLLQNLALGDRNLSNLGVHGSCDVPERGGASCPDQQ